MAQNFNINPIKQLKEEAERLQTRRNMIYGAYSAIVCAGLCGYDGDAGDLGLEPDLDGSTEVILLALRCWERSIKRGDT